MRDVIGDSIQAGRRPRAAPRRRLPAALLAPALLASAAIGAAIAVGSLLVRDQVVVVAPKPAPTDDAHVVNIPGPRETFQPDPTLVPLPSWDPSRLELVSDHGRTIRPTAIAVPDVPAGHRIGSLAAVGSVAWALVTDIGDEAVALLRVDAPAGAAAVVDLPARESSLELVTGPDTLWLRSRRSPDVYVLDPVSGELRETLQVPVQGGGFVGADADGLWFRIAAGTGLGGIALVDPETGAVIRRIYSPEEEGSYRGFWGPPAFGSLWDVDRARRLVLRIDAVSGAVQAEIDLSPLGGELKCVSDPMRGLVGVAELERLIVHPCNGREIRIDPATNSIARVVATEQGSVHPSFGAAVTGQVWGWVTRRDSTKDDWTATLVRVDPVTLTALETLTYNREHLGGSVPVVIGDAAWIVVGERASHLDPFAQNHVVLRIPVSDLAG